MRVSLNITNYSWSGPPEVSRDELAALATLVDRSDIDSLWVADHLLQADPNSQVDDPMLEAYTTLGYLAALTDRVRLGTMVTASTFRPPALLIKAVTTLDVLSAGRAWLGIGVGHDTREAEAMGLPFPKLGTRFDQLDELLRLANQMWSGDTQPFEGEHIRLANPVCRPLPVRHPRPTVLIGGMGERRTMPLVARYADACNVFDIPDGGQTVRRWLESLDRECAAIGRPPDEIERTLSTRLEQDETPREFVDRCAVLEEIGIDHVVAIVNGPWTEQSITVLADAANMERDRAGRRA